MISPGEMQPNLLLHFSVASLPATFWMNDGSAAFPVASGETVNYAYDTLNRLIAAATPGIAPADYEGSWGWPGSHGRTAGDEESRGAVNKYIPALLRFHFDRGPIVPLAIPINRYALAVPGDEQDGIPLTAAWRQNDAMRAGSYLHFNGPR